MEKLRIELRHVRGMYAMAQGEAIEASRKVYFEYMIYDIYWITFVLKSREFLVTLLQLKRYLFLLLRIFSLYLLLFQDLFIILIMFTFLLLNQLNELHKRHSDEENTLKQASLKEEELTKLARQEKERYEAAKREADFANECAEREAAERKLAEVRATREAREKENLENALMGSFNQYQKFTWEEIISATSTFSDNLKLGNGAYGTVYKGSFHHITAAVKILHAKEASRTKQFLQEVYIRLSLK